MISDQQAWYSRWAVKKKKGPGRGWWGPPKGTHGKGSQEGSPKTSLLADYEGTPKEKRKQLREEVKGWEGLRRDIGLDAADAGPYSSYLLETRKGKDNELVAIGSADLAEEKGILEITYLATKEPGHGRAAMRAFAEEAIKQDSIITLKASQDAIGFYEKLGLEMDDAYYGDEWAGVVYWWETADMESFLREGVG